MVLSSRFVLLGKVTVHSVASTSQIPIYWRPSDGNPSICDRMGRHVGTVHAHCWPHKAQLGPQSFVRPSMGTLPNVVRLVCVTR